MCHRDMVIHWQSDDIPYFGEIMYITSKCECSFRFTDTMILTQKDPVRYEITIEDISDLNARVIRSTSGTIRIPELGIDVEPGSASDSYVTNIEGILERIKGVVVTATSWSSDEPEKYAIGMELQKKLDEAIKGDRKLTIVIEDPLGNSAIISDKAISRLLSPDEAGELKSGMIILDVDSSEIKMDTPSGVQSIEK